MFIEPGARASSFSSRRPTLMRDSCGKVHSATSVGAVQVASQDKTLKTWPEAVHVMLHDPEQGEVMAAMCEWLDARL